MIASATACEFGIKRLNDSENKRKLTDEVCVVINGRFFVVVIDSILQPIK